MEWLSVWKCVAYLNTPRQTHVERRFMEAEASHRAVERNHDRTLAALREEAKKKVTIYRISRNPPRVVQVLVNVPQAMHPPLRNSIKATGVRLATVCRCSECLRPPCRRHHCSLDFSSISQREKLVLVSNSPPKFVRDVFDLAAFVVHQTMQYDRFSFYQPLRPTFFFLCMTLNPLRNLTYHSIGSLSYLRTTRSIDPDMVAYYNATIARGRRGQTRARSV